MRAIVTGRHGQVATALRRVAPARGVEIISLARPDFDLLDPSSARDAVEALRPDVVISAAAYTAVDLAESEAQAAFQINVDGPAQLARAAARLSIPILHLSTDYVFDGGSSRPYSESDPVNPLSIYGQSKLAGEEAVQRACENHVIARTSWVHSAYGKNFVRTMLRLAAERDSVRVVDDQFGAPTSADHLAEVLLQMARRLVEDQSPLLRGVFHVTNAGACSWADLAEEVFRHSAALDGPAACVERIGTDEFKMPAARPANSRLATDKLTGTYRLSLPDWREGVADTVLGIAADEGWQRVQTRARA